MTTTKTPEMLKAEIQQAKQELAKLKADARTQGSKTAIEKQKLVDIIADTNELASMLNTFKSIELMEVNQYDNDSIVSDMVSLAKRLCVNMSYDIGHFTLLAINKTIPNPENLFTDYQNGHYETDANGNIKARLYLATRKLPSSNPSAKWLDKSVYHTNACEVGKPNQHFDKSAKAQTKQLPKRKSK
jgi:hypothetical protein